MATVRPRLSEDDVAPGLIFIALGALACMTPAQNDTWWHLRSGQQMWQSSSFLLTEPFSHTAYGADLHNHWWLSQLAFYTVYSLGGPFLLTVFAGSCAATALVGSWRLMRGSWEIRVALLAWLVIATAGEWSIRPQVLSLVLLVLTAHIIVRDRLAWLPVICVVWANTHAMVIFGVLMSAAVALEALLWSRAEVKRTLGIAAACMAAPLVSPLGWSYWPQILKTVSVSRQLQIQEYRMPLDMGDLPFWLGLGALMVLVVRHGRTLRDRTRADRVLVIAALALAVAAATAARNVAFFAVVAAPALSRLWPMREAVRRRAPARVGAVGVAMLLVALVAGAAAVLARWAGGGARLGWRPMSAATIEAIRRCPDPIFNEMRDGGFLMWALPDRRVFIDSRMEAYPPELLRRSRDVDLGGDHADLFREYRIGCAITTSDSSLQRRLEHDPSMTYVHSDTQHTVFARSTQPNSVALSPILSR
jgi:hypothetical protein